MQTIQLLGRLTPKTKISLEQRTAIASSIVLKRIDPDMRFQPLMDDVVPFSEILNHRKMLQSIQPIQYIPEPPRVLRTQPRSVSKSVKSGRSDLKSEQKSVFSQKSYCTCSQCGCSRRSSRARKIQKIQIKQQQQKKRPESRKSIVSSDTLSQRKNLKQTSTASSKHRCEYHHYPPNREKIHTLHKEEQRQQRQSTLNPEQIRRQKLADYRDKQKKLLKDFSAKELNPKISSSIKPKIPWLCDEQRIKDGELRKSRIQKLIEEHQQSIVHKDRSQSKKSVHISPPKDKKKLLMLEARRKLMSQPKNMTNIHRDKKESERINKLVKNIKQQKQEKLEKTQKLSQRLLQIKNESKKQFNQCKRKPFKPTEEQIEQAFLNT